jgi:hypothetical protein
MAVTIELDTRRHWVRVRISSELTLDDALGIIRTARAPIERRMWPLLVDATGASTSMGEADIDRAAAEARRAAQQGPRGHVALVADTDPLYARLLLYETRLAEAGIRLIRVFRQKQDAEQWLEILSAARHF